MKDILKYHGLLNEEYIDLESLGYFQRGKSRISKGMKTAEDHLEQVRREKAKGRLLPERPLYRAVKIDPATGIVISSENELMMPEEKIE